MPGLEPVGSSALAAATREAESDDGCIAASCGDMHSTSPMSRYPIHEFKVWLPTRDTEGKGDRTWNRLRNNDYCTWLVLRLEKGQRAGAQGLPGPFPQRIVPSAPLPSAGSGRGERVGSVIVRRLRHGRGRSKRCTKRMSRCL